jgi:TfoX N-terminal domain
MVQSSPDQNHIGTRGTAMAYDEGLATRVREVLGDRPGLAERRMFGGLAFLLGGNMACGVRGDDLIVRMAADAVEPVEGEPGVRPFDLTGRPMKGWLLVGPDGHAEDDDLRRWVGRGLDYASSLPPKAP